MRGILILLAEEKKGKVNSLVTDNSHRYTEPQFILWRGPGEF
jgi:hypothetical protein